MNKIGLSYLPLLPHVYRANRYLRIQTAPPDPKMAGDSLIMNAATRGLAHTEASVSTNKVLARDFRFSTPRKLKKITSAVQCYVNGGTGMPVSR